jgi:hypothetical protein
LLAAVNDAWAMPSFALESASPAFAPPPALERQLLSQTSDSLTCCKIEPHAEYGNNHVDGEYLLINVREVRLAADR